MRLRKIEVDLYREGNRLTRFEWAASGDSCSGRAIATYDTSGYARGVAAIGEGARDLGAGIMTAGKALGAYAAQQAEAERKIDAARGQVALTVTQLARGNAIARDTDPVGLVARHVNEAAKEVEQVAQSVSDPQLRGNVLQHRDGYVADVAQRAERQRGVLAAEGGMSRAWEAVDALGAEALRSDDPSAMNRAADVFHDYVDTLRAVGWVDDTKAADIKRNWATGIAERALLQASPEDRVAAIAAAKVESKSESEPAAATGAEVPASAAIPSIDTAQPQASSDLTQLVRMLPAEVRERIDLESQAEIGRTQASRVWEKAGQYEDAMEKASRGDPQPAPWRAAIEADPDLDDRTRARLLQKHDAIQQKLDRFWSAKAEYDEPNGRKFDVNDDNDRTFVEQMYNRLGGDMPALHAVANRTGIMPASAYARMHGGLASNDPERVGQTLKALAHLAETSPEVLLPQSGGDGKLQYALTQFRHATAQGDTPEQAIRGIIASRPSESGERPADENDHATAVARATSPSDLKHLFGTNPIISAALLSVYPELVTDRLAATSDISLAKAQALDQASLLVASVDDIDSHALPSDRAKETNSAPIDAEERKRLHKNMAYFDTFIGMMQFARWMEVKPSVDAGLSPDELIKKHAPGLNLRGQEARRQATLEYFAEIPALYNAALADRAKFDAMPPASTAEEALAAASGYAEGSAWGVERLFGPTRFARLAMMLALRSRLPTPGNASGSGAPSGIRVPQTAGWWQTALPGQAINNGVLGLGTVIAGAPPLQPGQGAVADQGRRLLPPAAQPVPPSDEEFGLPPPPPVSAPVNPTLPVTVPRIDSSTQSTAEEKKENERKIGEYHSLEIIFLPTTTEMTPH